MNTSFFKYYYWRLLNPIVSCAFCSLPSFKLLCDDCYLEIETLSTNKCHLCAKPNTSLCLDCRGKEIFIDRCYCNFIYSVPLNKLLHQFKYKQKTKYMWILGYLLHQTLNTISLNEIDYIIPMPLSYQRLQQRKFNQVELMLFYYMAKSNTKQVKTNYVRKILDTPHQSLAKKFERNNIDNVFEISTKVTNKRVLIIDDVITSGATANSLAKALKHAGAIRVEICALMRSVMSNNDY